MANKVAIFALVCMTITASFAAVHGVTFGPKAVNRWFKRLPHAQQKVTKLHFYFHDTITGKNPTSFQIAQSDITNKSKTVFGALFMIDDPLTVSPDPNSAVIGRAQGIFGSASLTELSLLMTLNFYFTQGEHNGSTLSVLGRNPIFNEFREMPIVGGSGVFRLAQGIATAKTYQNNVTAKNAIVEYHVEVLHYA